MYNDIQKGMMRFKNARYIWEIAFASETLIELLTRYQDEFPDLKYNETYMLLQTLITLKNSAIELLGKDGIKE